MTWYYADGGKQAGPVDEAALDDLVRRGVVREDTLVWREGMASWQPHGVARPRPAGSVATAAPPPPAPSFPAAAPPPPAGGSEMRYCAECGRPFPAHDLSMVGAAAVCAGCRPVVAQRMGSAIPAAQPMIGAVGGRRYGGFWIRFVAVIIDAIILWIISFIVQMPLRLLGLGGAGLLASRNDPAAAMAALPMVMGLVGISFLVQLAISLIYEVYFLTSRGATPGKIALGLKVIRADGGPITAGLAIGRYFAKWVSSLTLLIGYIIAGFDTEKRSLHDRICETRVIYVK